jgi:putative FmdB family regulatory protein
MPLFEYACQACDHQFEALVRNGQAPTCPSCESPRLQKRQSVFAARSAGGPSSASEAPMSGGCGHCGDPRGPGSCSLN